MFRQYIDRQIAIWQDWLLVVYSAMELYAQLFGGRRSSSSSWSRDTDNLTRYVRDHYHIHEPSNGKQTESLSFASALDKWLDMMEL